MGKLRLFDELSSIAATVLPEADAGEAPSAEALVQMAGNPVLTADNSSFAPNPSRTHEQANHRAVYRHGDAYWSRGARKGAKDKIGVTRKNYRRRRVGLPYKEPNSTVAKGPNPILHTAQAAPVGGLSMGTKEWPRRSRRRRRTGAVWEDVSPAVSQPRA